TNQVQGLPGLVVCAAVLLKRWHQRHVSENLPMRKQAAVLLHVANAPPQHYRRLLSHVLLGDEHFSLLRLDQAIETPQQRRLSRAAFSDQRRRAPGRNLEADVVESDYATKTVRYVPRAKRCRHALKSARDNTLCRYRETIA